MHDSPVVRLPIPDGRAIEVWPRAAEHPLLGSCDVVALGGGPALGRFQAVDWDRPRHIPALDRPGALPAGAGTALLNEIARRAPGPLRYLGPYPTAALFDALLECFRVDDPADALSRFTAGVEDIALRGVMHEPAVDFWPAPFHRLWHEPSVCVQVRAGVEKIYVRGRGHARDADGPRRVRATAGGWAAVVEIAGAEWARVAEVDASGVLLHGPHPVPPVQSPLLGRAVPDAVRHAMARVLAARAPVLMQRALHDQVRDTPMVWGDTGDELAAVRDGRLEIHAVLMERMQDAPPLAILEAMARAVEPVAQRMAQAALERAVLGRA